MQSAGMHSEMLSDHERVVLYLSNNGHQQEQGSRTKRSCFALLNAVH